MTTPVPPTPEEEAARLKKLRGGTRRVMVGVKLWPNTAKRYKALGLKHFPEANPDRVTSPFVRDYLVAMGEAAYNAGYRPGDSIPPKRS